MKKKTKKGKGGVVTYFKPTVTKPTSIDGILWTL